MPSAEIERQLIIQIERPGPKLQMDDARALLGPHGVRLDPDYGPIAVNPRLGRYVVRGTATREALDRIRELEGVTVFSDSRIAPAGR